MSWQAMEAAMDATYPEMPPGPGRRRGVSGDKLKLVAIAIAYRADEVGDGSHPGIRQIAQRAQTTLAHARDALDALTELGVITLAVPSIGRDAAVYDLHLEVLSALWKTAESARPRGARNENAQARASARPERRAQARASRGAHEVLKNVSTRSEPPAVRLVANAPDSEEKRRAAALLAEAAEHSMNPDLFGKNFREWITPAEAIAAYDEKERRRARYGGS